MSLTDSFHEIQEKKAKEHSDQLMKEELETKKNFKELFDSLQEFLNTMECSLINDDEARISLSAYGEAFMSECYRLLKSLNDFERKFQRLY